MDLLIVGLNHNTAPVALREQVAFSPEQLGTALHDLKAACSLREVAILSTCNRTELYCVTDQEDPSPITQWLCDYHQLPNQELADSIYVSQREAAVAHVMRVATGLDSLVLGEPQILGQVKEAFTRSENHQCMGPELRRLSQNTYRIAKQARSSTSIGKNPVSVASTSVMMASQLFSDLATCEALLIGAGETIELVGLHLKNAGVSKIVIANRTLANAQRLADKLGATAITLSGIADYLPQTDVLIASTGSQLPILGKGTVESALKQRRHRPIFMVDLAVPRDIETEVSSLRDVYLYTVDDLQEIVARHMDDRKVAALEAESIVQQAVSDYAADHRSLHAVETLIALRQHHEEAKTDEVKRAVQQLRKGEDPHDVIHQLANRLTNKIVHTPTVELKKAGAEGREDLLEAARKLFQLSINDNGDEESM